MCEIKTRLCLEVTDSPKPPSRSQYFFLLLQTPIDTSFLYDRCATCKTVGCYFASVFKLLQEDVTYRYIKCPAFHAVKF